jgi:hypothetical protein
MWVKICYSTLKISTMSNQESFDEHSKWFRFFAPSNHISWCSIAFFKLCSIMWSTEWVIVAHWLCSDIQRWDDYQTANTSPVSYVIDNNGSWGAHFSICLSEIEKNSEAVAISHQVTCKTGPFLHCCFTYCKQIWLGRITFTAKLL